MVCLNGFSSLPLHALQYSADKPLGSVAQSLPDYLKHAGVEQRLNQPLPLSTAWVSDAGTTAPLSSYFQQRPVVLALVYYKCGMLCPQVLHGLADGLRQSPLTPGKDYDVVIASIDPSDTTADAAAAKRTFLDTLGNSKGNPKAAAALHFLTGPQASIDALAAATGFHYVRVPGPDGKLDQFAHSSVIMFATPDGRLSKYLSGVQFEPRDLRLALLDASARKISNPVDLFLLYCCSYNPAIGKYTVSILRILSIAGMGSLLIMAGMFYMLTRKPKPPMAA